MCTMCCNSKWRSDPSLELIEVTPLKGALQHNNRNCPCIHGVECCKEWDCNPKTLLGYFQKKGNHGFFANRPHLLGGMKNWFWHPSRPSNNKRSRSLRNFTAKSQCWVWAHKDHHADQQTGVSRLQSWRNDLKFEWFWVIIAVAVTRAVTVWYHYHIIISFIDW